MEDDALTIELAHQVPYRINGVLDAFVGIAHLAQRGLQFPAKAQGIGGLGDRKDTFLLSHILEPDEPVVALQRHDRLGGGIQKRLRDLFNYEFVW